MGGSLKLGLVGSFEIGVVVGMVVGEVSVLLGVRDGGRGGVIGLSGRGAGAAL